MKTSINKTTHINETIRNLLKIAGIYLIIALLFFIAAEKKIKYTDYNKTPLLTNDVIGEIVDNDIITQDFSYDGDYLQTIILKGATYSRKNTGQLFLELWNGEELVTKKQFDVSKLKDNSNLVIDIKHVSISNAYKLVLFSKDCTYGNAVTFYTEEMEDSSYGELSRNDNVLNARLGIVIEGGIKRWFGSVYWKLVFIGLILVEIIGYLFIFRIRHANNGGILKRIGEINKYKFLLKQLVGRDFKTKYKRSVLGFCWSFLNPLLTMAVQYIVFSTIFRSDIDNFPVYLLSAGIMFNFFTESVGAGLGAIVGNVSLITKVYVPKYIYPLSRVLSTTINLLISLVPLLVLVLLTGESITRAFLLLPYVLLCLIAFCIGMSFLLSTSMVFFRDTQFLWGIISLIWMYGTPIFYPETIIPDRFQFVLSINPMYHFLKFFRTILMTGQSPALMEYVYCFGFSFTILILGAFVFEKCEKKFVLYL